jgi:hypothetical protein
LSGNIKKSFWSVISCRRTLKADYKRSLINRTPEGSTKQELYLDWTIRAIGVFVTKSNVIKFLPPMTFNKNFVSSFVGENRPCAALGIIETVGQQAGFLAFKPDKAFSASTGQNGFDLGSELLGTDKVAVLHLILKFDSMHVYDVLLNLNSPVVKKVFKVWEKTGNYFFFAFTETGFIAFEQKLGEAWYVDNYFGKAEKATNTQSQYENSVNAIKKNDMIYGTYIDLIFQNKVEFLDLTENRFEVKSR